jgi:hypothetical protein
MDSSTRNANQSATVYPGTDLRLVFEAPALQK